MQLNPIPAATTRTPRRLFPNTYHQKIKWVNTDLIMDKCFDQEMTFKAIASLVNGIESFILCACIYILYFIFFCCALSSTLLIGTRKR